MPPCRKSQQTCPYLPCSNCHLWHFRTVAHFKVLAQQHGLSFCTPCKSTNSSKSCSSSRRKSNTKPHCSPKPGADHYNQQCRLPSSVEAIVVYPNTDAQQQLAESSQASIQNQFDSYGVPSSWHCMGGSSKNFPPSLGCKKLTQKSFHLSSKNSKLPQTWNFCIGTYSVFALFCFHFPQNYRP